MTNECITTECVCDLPESMLKSLHVDIIYFHIYTERGCFKDTDEVNASNIIEYMINGGQKSKSEAPSVNEYKSFFQKKLESCDEIIHIAISSGISDSVKNASLAVAKMGLEGKRVHIFDSEHLSSGMGLMVMQAVKMRHEGCRAKQILEELEKMRQIVSTSFIVKNADFLFRNGKVSKSVRNLCSMFSLHPVLYMKNGVLTLKGVEIGNYEKAGIRYVKKELRHANKIDKTRLFITHANCRLKRIQQIKEIAARYCEFEEVVVNLASATVSSNCGPEAFGVLFVWKGAEHEAYTGGR